MARPKRKPTIEQGLTALINQAVEEKQFELSKKLITMLDESMSLDRNQAAKEGENGSAS